LEQGCNKKTATNIVQGGGLPGLHAWQSSWPLAQILSFKLLPLDFVLVEGYKNL
jgi:hypothetical protein